MHIAQMVRPGEAWVVPESLEPSILAPVLDSAPCPFAPLGSQFIAVAASVGSQAGRRDGHRHRGPARGRLVAPLTRPAASELFPAQLCAQLGGICLPVMGKPLWCSCLGGSDVLQGEQKCGHSWQQGILWAWRKPGLISGIVPFLSPEWRAGSRALPAAERAGRAQHASKHGQLRQKAAPAASAQRLAVLSLACRLP